MGYLRLLSGAYFLGLVAVELFEAVTNTPPSLIWESIPTVLVSVGIVVGTIVLVRAGLLGPRAVLMVVVLAFLATLGSGYHVVSYPPVIRCGVGSSFGGFPFPWFSRWIFSRDEGCPLPLLPLQNPGPLLGIFLTDMLFYLAIGISTLELARYRLQFRSRV